MQKRMPGAMHCAAARRWMQRKVCCAAEFRRIRRAGCGTADLWALRRIRRAVRCAVILALVLLLCGDMVLPPRQDLLLPELGAVERQLRALTAGAPDGWRYSLRVSPGPGGTALAADAARRDASGTWETIHTLWRCENGAWRMVRQTRRRLCPPPGAQGNDP